MKTRPSGDQLKFQSEATGEHVLDTYLEAAEKGGRTLPDILADLWEDTGAIRQDVFQFRAQAGKLQARTGDYIDPEAGWRDIGDYMRDRGQFSAAASYDDMDLVQVSDGSTYLTQLSAPTSYTTEAAFIAAGHVLLIDIAQLNTAVGEAEYAASAAEAAEAAAGGYSSAAQSSATAAANSASAAQTSATNAAASETAAATSASNAATSEGNAATSASNASTSETNASTSAGAAATSEANAASSAAAAQASATAAQASEDGVNADALAAQSAANAAATSETNAASSAGSASTDAANAAADRAAAEQAKTDAEAAQVAATQAKLATEGLFDSFDDRFLGPKATEPTLDNDGAALIEGALYWDTGTQKLRIYNGTAWENTADGQMTAADMLALMKTIDGTGSGLDADLLDGNHASAFAKLSGATFTDTISVVKSEGGTITQFNAPNHSQLRLGADTNNRRIVATNAAGGVVYSQMLLNEDDLSFRIADIEAARIEAAGTEVTDPQSVITREKGDARYAQTSGATFTGQLNVTNSVTLKPNNGVQSYLYMRGVSNSGNRGILYYSDTSETAILAASDSAGAGTRWYHFNPSTKTQTTSSVLTQGDGDARYATISGQSFTGDVAARNLFSNNGWVYVDGPAGSSPHVMLRDHEYKNRGAFIWAQGNGYVYLRRYNDAGASEGELILKPTSVTYNSHEIWHAGNDDTLFKTNEGAPGDLVFNASSGRGMRFWGDDRYKVHMANVTDGSYGGDLTGWSDYNLYFDMGGGTSRGFVWRNGGSPVGELTGLGKLYTKSHVVAGKGSGSVGLTLNDGEGNASVTFNHVDGTPDQDGNAGRITVNTDATTGASMTFGLRSGVTGGVATGTIGTLTLYETYATLFGHEIVTENTRHKTPVLHFSPAASFALDMSAADSFEIRVDKDITMIAPTGATPGQTGYLRLIQGGGGNTISFSDDWLYDWKANLTPGPDNLDQIMVRYYVDPYGFIQLFVDDDGKPIAGGRPTDVELLAAVDVTTHQVTIPSYVKPGDLMVYNCGHTGGSGTANSASTDLRQNGWTLVTSQGSSGWSTAYFVYAKIATSADAGATYTTRNGSVDRGHLRCFRGPERWTGFTSQQSATITDSNPSGRSVTPTATGDTVAVNAVGSEGKNPVFEYSSQILDGLMTGNPIASSYRTWLQGETVPTVQSDSADQGTDNFAGVAAFDLIREV